MTVAEWGQEKTRGGGGTRKKTPSSSYKVAFRVSALRRAASWVDHKYDFGIAVSAFDVGLQYLSAGGTWESWGS